MKKIEIKVGPYRYGPFEVYYNNISKSCRVIPIVANSAPAADSVSCFCDMLHNEYSKTNPLVATQSWAAAWCELEMIEIRDDIHVGYHPEREEYTFYPLDPKNDGRFSLFSEFY